MSRVFRALEKAEKEKQERQKKDASSAFGKEASIPGNEEIVVPTEVGEAERASLRSEKAFMERLRKDDSLAFVKEASVPRSEEIVAPAKVRDIKKVPLRSEKASILMVPPDSFSGEEFRKLKTQIFHWSANPPHTILVTSTTPGEGKTTVSFNLALAIGQEIQKRAILIDADLRRPSVLLNGHSNGKGLSNYLAEGVSLSEIMIHFHEGNLSVIPAGPPSRKPSELLGTGRMKELIVSLRGLGEDTFIIIDSPPVLSTSEPILISKMVDGVIFVMMADRTPRESAKKAIKSINAEKIIGIVLNQVDLKSRSYYSKYYSVYSKR
jgi:capsular exopolysaccharide synthesis family protein